MKRLAACWRFKLVLLIVLPTGFCLGYFTLQRVTLFHPVELPLTVLDRAVPFTPEWIYAYQSVYLFLPIAPLLATRREQLVHYTRGFVALSLAGFAVFLLFPVISPRPEGETGVAAFDLLTRYEGTLNAFPSLHAGLLAYTLLFAGWTFKDDLSPAAARWLAVVALAWSGAILYATLATKQHYAVDLPAGIVLAWLSHRWSRPRAS